jgi:hypothetical protein
MLLQRCQKSRPLGPAVLALGILALAALQGQDDTPTDVSTLFDWDLVSLEQNNPRFNASVLSGFHSIRSPGVTPNRAWKTGLGILYTREQQIAEGTNTELFNREQVIFNPKINYGLLGHLEAGAGFEASWASGEEPEFLPDGTVQTQGQESWEASAVDLGLKWGFLKVGRLRLGLAFDSRIAVNKGAFGSLEDTIYNAEIDGDFAVTSRVGILSNLQYLTTDHFFQDEQVVFDLGTSYSFSDRFRGMLFGTLQDDSEADDVLIFAGIAAQYVFEQHSFTLALDLQLNEAYRDVRTQKQVDVEFSYTFTF